MNFKNIRRRLEDEQFDVADAEGRPISAADHLRVLKFIDVTGWTDFILAALVAVVTIILQFAWAYPELHPSCWEWSALATLARPPSSPIQSVWTAGAAYACSLFGIDGGLALMKILGHLAAGLLAGIVYYFLRFVFSQRFALPPDELAPCVMRLRFAAVAGSLVFAFSEFVWRQGQFFTADFMRIILLVVSVICYIVYLKRESLGWYSFAFVFAGILSAESPIGILLALGFFVASIVKRLVASAPFRPELINQDPLAPKFEEEEIVPEDIDDDVVRENQELTSSLENWSFCVFYFVPFLMTMLADAWIFNRLGGMVVRNLGNWAYLMVYLSSWIDSIVQTMSLDDILIAMALMGIPFLVSFLLMPLATNGKSRLAFPVGGLIVLMGLFAETQLGPWSPFWYWSWGGRETSVSSGAVQMLMAFFGSGAVMSGLLVLICASRRRVLGIDTLVVSENWIHAQLRRFGALIVILIAVGIVLTSAFGRRQPYLKRQLSALGDYVNLQVAHADSMRWVLTDGSFDDALRVAFRRRNKTTAPISAMSGRGTYECYLRCREALDAEDIPMLEAGGSEVLRYWVSEKPRNLEMLAAQLGYTTLNKSTGAVPRSAGTAMRVVRSPEDLAAFQKADLETREFSQEILKLSKVPRGATGGFDLAVREKFDFMLWRLARMADQRARFCSIAGDSDGVRIDREIASDLDHANVSLRRLAVVLEKLRPSDGVVLTPREGLMVALQRADFELAARYALVVMRDDAENERANFALAMWALEEHDYAKAARHFEIAIKKNPEDPTLFNNVAIAYFKSGSYALARERAETALKLKPDLAVTKRLLADIEKAEKEASAK